MKKIVSSIIIATLSLNILSISAQNLNPSLSTQQNIDSVLLQNTDTTDVEVTVSLNDYPTQTAYEVVFDILAQEGKTFKDLKILIVTSDSVIKDHEIKAVLDAATNLRVLNMSGATHDHNSVTIQSPYSGHQSLEELYGPGRNVSQGDTFDNEFKMGYRWFTGMPKLKVIDLSYAYSVPPYAFSNSENLEHVMLSKTYKHLKINDRAFYSLRKLSTINTEGVEFIGNDAFYNAGTLNGFTANFTDNLKEIRTSAFNNSGLTKISLPKTHRYSVGNNAFANTKRLQSIDLSFADVVGNSILNNSNIQELVLPNIPFHVTEYSFFRLSKLRDISNTENITGFTSEDFMYLGSDVEPSDIVNLNFNFLNIPSNYKFKDTLFTSSKIQSVKFAPGVSNLTLGKYMFEQANELKTLDFRAVSNIGQNAFWYADLESIDLKDINVGDNAFSYNSNIDTLTINENTNLGRGAFSNTGIQEIKITTDIIGSEELFARFKTTSLDISPIKHFAYNTFYGAEDLDVLFFKKDTLNTTIDSEAFEGITSIVFIHEDKNQDYLEEAILENSTDVTVYRYSDQKVEDIVFNDDIETLQLKSLNDKTLDKNLTPIWYKDGVEYSTDKELTFNNPTEDDAGLYVLKLKSKHHDEEFVVAQYRVALPEPVITIELDINNMQNKYFKGDSLNLNGLNVLMYEDGTLIFPTSAYTTSLKDKTQLLDTGLIPIVVTLDSDNSVHDTFMIKVSDVLPEVIELKINDEFTFDFKVDGVLITTSDNFTETIDMSNQTKTSNNYSFKALKSGETFLTYTMGDTSKTTRFIVTSDDIESPQPEKPKVPETPEIPKDKNTELPDTGISNNYFLYTVLVLVCSSMIFLILKKRKNNHK